MATAAKKFPDAELVHQLGQVLDAAFLYAGFVPYGVQSGTSLCVCRRYTAPQLAHHEDAEAAVLILCAAPGCRDVALVMFLTRARDMRGVYLERLDAANLQQGGRRRSSTISWNLADGVCRVLLEQLRSRSGLTPPVPGFRSLPDDAMVEVLKRLPSGADLARVECTCRDLRRVVSARDGELWRNMYSNWSWALSPFFWEQPRKTYRFGQDLLEHEVCTYDLDDLVQEGGNRHVRDHRYMLQRLGQWGPFVPLYVKNQGEVSWKDKYLEAMNVMFKGSQFRLPSTTAPMVVVWRLSQRQNRPDDADKKTRKIIISGHHKKAPWKTYKDKRCRCTGAIHTPSARYRWRHG